jgi:hypothetical protein
MQTFASLPYPPCAGLDLAQFGEGVHRRLVLISIKV